MGIQRSLNAYLRVDTQIYTKKNNDGVAKVEQMNIFLMFIIWDGYKEEFKHISKSGYTNIYKKNNDVLTRSKS